MFEHFARIHFLVLKYLMLDPRYFIYYIIMKLCIILIKVLFLILNYIQKLLNMLLNL